MLGLLMGQSELGTAQKTRASIYRGSVPLDPGDRQRLALTVWSCLRIPGPHGWPQGLMAGVLGGSCKAVLSSQASRRVAFSHF